MFLHHDTSYRMGTGESFEAHSVAVPFKGTPLELEMMGDQESRGEEQNTVNKKTNRHPQKMGECPLAEDIVFTSLDTHLSFTVFLEQLCFHLFFPLFVPYAWLRYGTSHARVQSYHLADYRSYLTTYIPLLCVAISVVSFVVHPRQHEYAQALVPFSFLFLHRLMVATKYATLSPDEYRDFLNIGRDNRPFQSLSPHDRRKIVKFQGHMQLVPGWLFLPEQLVRHELMASSLNQGIDLHELFFYIPVGAEAPTREANPEKMYSDWLRLFRSFQDLSAEEAAEGSGETAQRTPWKRTPDGNYLKVLCMDVYLYMFLVLTKRVKAVIGKVMLGILVVDAIVVFNYVSKFAHTFTSQIEAKAFFIANTYLLAVFFPMLLLFCVSALADVFRRYHISKMLRELISVSDVSSADTRVYGGQRQSIKLHSMSYELKEMTTLNSFGVSTMPRIDMSMPANHTSWCMSRLVLSGFGKRFLRRTDFYIVILAVLALAQVLNTLYDMFLNPDLTTHQVCSSFSFSQTLLSLSAMTLVLCVLLLGIYLSNHNMTKHRVPLSMHLLHAKKATHEVLFRSSMASAESRHGGGRRARSCMKNPTSIHTNAENNSGKDHGKAGYLSAFATRSHSAEEYETEDHRVLAVGQLQECAESLTAVVQTVVEVDNVQPRRLMNMRVEKEFIISILSSAAIYAIVLYNYCEENKMLSGPN